MKGEEFTVEAELAGRYLDVCYKPISGPQGVLDGATCVAYDVTDRVVTDARTTEAGGQGADRQP